ncbi:30S ribosomal protein S6 [Dolosicoccus paucivorans]|uniref:30S ribosomal protein S6 n=1 Tax=Dolosicoccus paucivorans TaxID=84521 RepID=UPI000885425E|nr:30S ribosomal protein S6 [Dolosicoccus paucivorans]PMB84731.1 30S ribosomal protein S6 [Dolosicoccus paucivorans]SDI39160.1 SSU ribosomal protein S6P [Dolosicoccus paucivorans]
MQTRKYEILYIIRPDLGEDDRKALVERFDAIIANSGAENLESKEWEKRRLAYEIKDYKEGLYHIMTFETASEEGLNEFTRLANYSRDILRFMITKQED